MANVVNIPRTITDAEDPFYRYKMPLLRTRIEGRGKMIKTCIENMGDVAEALMRSPVLVTKWFGYELGAQVEYTSKQGKKGDGERCTISGGHTSESLQTCLDRFIEKYVLCQDSECGKPEIDMVLKRGAPLAAKCRACKWRGELDNCHRVADFILKHPALNTTGFGRDGGKEGRATGKHKKDSKDRKDEHEKDKEPSKERQKERRKSRTSSTTSSEDAEQGGAGAQANAEENGQDQGEDASVLAPAPPLYDKEEANAAIADLRVLAATGAGAGVSEALQALPLSENFESRARLYVALEEVCGNAMDAAKIKAAQAALGGLVAREGLLTADVLWAFGAYVGAHGTTARAYPHVLKALYDADLVEEEALLSFYRGRGGAPAAAGPGFEMARAAAEPFLRWLETAESEED